VNLNKIAQAVGLENLTPEIPADDSLDVSGGYASDLLSDVLAHAPRGGVLVTIQVHLNVIAVAVHAELSAVVFAANRRPDDDVRRKAVDEGVVLYSARESSFDVAGRLYALGLRGPHE